MEENIITGYEPMEGCYGIVIERCRTGAYLQLDNGENAFAYRFGNLRTGTKVLCTVLREPREGKQKLVSIDSVLYETVAA